MTRVASLRVVEAQISTCLDLLISLLDALHGDPDFEDEPIEDCDQDIDQQPPRAPDLARVKRIRRARS